MVTKTTAPAEEGTLPDITMKAAECTNHEWSLNLQDNILPR